MDNKSSYRLDTPIFLDYDVNNLVLKIHCEKKLKTIKGHFEKHGFEEKGKTDESITIFKNAIKKKEIPEKLLK